MAPFKSAQGTWHLCWWRKFFFQVSKIVEDIYEQLCGNPSPMMKSVMLHVISVLTRASPKKVIFQLMEFPVPADK
jgi:hypothetical protein